MAKRDADWWAVTFILWGITFSGIFAYMLVVSGVPFPWGG
jgi:hypothetical protein